MALQGATWSVAVGPERVTAAFEPATAAATGRVFVFAHGAGGHMADRGMLALAAQFRARGVHVVRFNFPYSERQSRRPDPMPVLQSCIAAVAARATEEIGTDALILGGRSMGGRAASMLVADGHPCAGLLLLAYPLHPAAREDRLRDAHLPRIGQPVLCFNGTRDPLCRRDLMEGVVARLAANWRMHWLEGADHSFHVTRVSGRDDDAVREEIGAVTAGWIASLSRRPAADRRSPR
jgi:predicted alpha/beta-hydrolase family hydrolase